MDKRSKEYQQGYRAGYQSGKRHKNNSETPPHIIRMRRERWLRNFQETEMKLNPIFNKSFRMAKDIEKELVEA